MADDPTLTNSDIAELLRAMKTEQASQTSQITAIAVAHRTVADEVHALGLRMRKAEEGIQRSTLAHSEAHHERATLQRAVMAHVDAFQKSISTELDALRVNDRKQNSELTAQTEKLDLLLQADRDRKGRERVLTEIAQSTRERVDSWKSRVEIASGVLGIISVIVTALLWVFHK